MLMTHLTVENYRALANIEIPLSRFGCLIGKNNAGKSTVMQAISLFFSGNKLTPRDFYDATKPIRIVIRFESISEEDLGRLAQEHRDEFRATVKNGCATLARRYELNGSSKLFHVLPVPSDPRFSDNQIGTWIKGKKGKDLLNAAVEAFPELKDKLKASPTQADVKDEIAKLAADIPEDQKHLDDVSLVTGIDASIRPMLPEVIYVAAVKDLNDDVKTKESSPFGRVLAILLEAIEPELGNIKDAFSDLAKKFNRVKNEKGVLVDERMPQVRQIEETVEKYLQESFSNTSLQITMPPPELRTFLSSAEILVNDGVTGNIETKGDGLRRAAVFAILRSYVALTRPDAFSADGAKKEHLNDRHVLLFEEPELYLHPSAQRVLFDALSLFAENNHVVITTHSPSFLGPQGTASFIKLIKMPAEALRPIPHTVAKPVRLTDIQAKDQFQLICFENNNAAFFFDSIVLIEGDSDYIVLPHIAKLLSPHWESSEVSHKFVRISGKGSIKRYKEFFKRFEVRIAVVSDLDLITDGFGTIEPTPELNTLRSNLLNITDKIVEQEGGFEEPTNKELKEAAKKTELLGLWRLVKEASEKVKSQEADISVMQEAIDRFFSWEKKDARLNVLRNSESQELLKAKWTLLHELRKHDVFILQEGALEAYYPENIVKGDKPTMALDFCQKYPSSESVLALCKDSHCPVNGPLGKEFQVICDSLFGKGTA